MSPILSIFFFSISFLLFYSFYLIFSLRNISFFLLFFPFSNSVSSPIFSTLQVSLFSHTHFSLVLHPPYLSSAVYFPIISMYIRVCLFRQYFHFLSSPFLYILSILFSISSLVSLDHWGKSLMRILVKDLARKSRLNAGLNMRPYNSVKTPVLRPNSWT